MLSLHIKGSILSLWMQKKNIPVSTLEMITSVRLNTSNPKIMTFSTKLYDILCSPKNKGLWF